MRSLSSCILAGCIPLGVVAVFDGARAMADEAWSLSSTVSDPVGDTIYNGAPAFQDMVLGRMTKTASGDFELHMELAGSVPADPGMPPPARTEIWWVWVFDLDPTTSPSGYPFREAGGRRPEFIVYVSWNGSEFAGTAIDRRPLLTGEEPIITPVEFDISDTMVDALLPSTLIGEVPASFEWGPLTFSWSGPVGSEGNHFVDVAALAIFNP